MKAELGFFVFVILSIALFGYMISPATTAGIQITHNGKPINNLEVRVYLPGCQDTCPVKVLTTDGTGIVTITITNSKIWGGGSILYDFGFNGTIYSFSEPLTQIVEVSV